jgi:hypothetical protein
VFGSSSKFVSNARIFAFLEDPYTAKCLEPLKERINSSTVPADFKADDPATDPAIVEEA